MGGSCGLQDRVFMSRIATGGDQLVIAAPLEFRHTYACVRNSKPRPVIDFDIQVIFGNAVFCKGGGFQLVPR